jgi:hypothetical protein
MIKASKVNGARRAMQILVSKAGLIFFKRGQKHCSIRLIKEKVYKVVMEPYYNTHYSPGTK